MAEVNEDPKDRENKSTDQESGTTPPPPSVKSTHVDPNPNRKVSEPAPELPNLTKKVDPIELHQPHIKGHQKKFKDYLFEFFMLFFAVTLGFFVENKREELSDAKKERQYIQSFIQDMRDDSNKINQNISSNNWVLAGLDSLISDIYLFKKNDTSIVRKLYWHYLYYGRNHYTVNFTDRTLSQLKNSGNFRLIASQQVSDSIISYDEWVKFSVAQERSYKESWAKALEFSSGIFDYKFLRYNIYSSNGGVAGFAQTNNYKLLTEDPITLNKYANQLELAKQMIVVYLWDLQSVKTKANQIIPFLKKEYDLK